MADNKRTNLDAAVAGIRQRFGTNILRTGDEYNIHSLSTGFAWIKPWASGMPRGNVTEISGAPTSGAHTLAYKLIASAHQARQVAVYLDLASTFDPDYAVRCGIDIGNVLLVRPANAEAALDIANSFAANRGAGIIVLDSPFQNQFPAKAFARLLAPWLPPSVSFWRLWSAQIVLLPMPRCGCHWHVGAGCDNALAWVAIKLKFAFSRISTPQCVTLSR
jgi:hypothetical protein